MLKIKGLKGLYVLIALTVLFVLSGCGIQESAESLSRVEAKQNFVTVEDKFKGADSQFVDRLNSHGNLEDDNDLVATNSETEENVSETQQETKQDIPLAEKETTPVSLEEVATVKNESQVKSKQVSTQQTVNQNPKSESSPVEKTVASNQVKDSEPFDIDEYYATEHKEIIELGHYYKIPNLEVLDYLIRHTEYSMMLFYTDGCFAKVYNSANMLEEQHLVVEQVPDAVFANIDLEDFPELGELIGIKEAPYAVFLHRGQPVHIQEGYMSPSEIVNVINTKIKK